MNGMNEYYFPTFEGNSNQQLALTAPAQTAYMMNNQQYLAAGAATSHYPAGMQEENFLPFPEEQCSHFGCFFEEEFSFGTESDNDADPIPEAAIYQTLVRGDPNNNNDLLQAVYQDYAWVKKLWRRLSKKPPRRYRKFNRFQKKQTHQ